MVWLSAFDGWCRRHVDIYSRSYDLFTIISARFRSVTVAGIVFATFFSGSFGSPVFAQEDQLQTQSSSEVVSNDAPNSSTSKRYLDYRNFYYEKIEPLAKEAERRGLSASQKEIDAEKAVIGKMYPGNMVSEQMINNEILARKYAQTILNINPSEHDKEQAYKEILAQFSGEEAPSEQEMVSLIESRAIGNCQVTKDVLMRLGEYNEQRRVDYENENPEEMWSVEDLQIKSNDDYCLARHPDSSNCQLSVRRFNALVKYQPFPKAVPLDTARLQAIQNILSDEYILIQARKNGYDKTDSAAEAVKGRLKWDAHDARFKNLGTPVTDDGMLHIVYDQHYDLLFSPRKTPYYSMIGSTDSLYIDSLAQLISLKKPAKTAKEKATVKDTAWVSSMPWSRSSGIVLPSVFVPFVDSLRKGEVSKPIRTSYGFFLVRLDSISTREEVPFQDATETLVLLATKKRWRNFDSTINAKAFYTFTTAKLFYKTKDTLSLAFFLHPGIRPDSTIVTRKKEVKWEDEVQRMVVDKGMKLSSHQLPVEIIDSLQCQYAASKKKSRFFGPLISPYGVGYCKVLGVKPGNGSISYSQVKKRLLDSLVIASIDSGECVTFEKPDSVLTELTLARVYAPIFLEDDGSGNIAQTGGADSKAMQAKFDAIEAWVAKMKIRIP